MARKSSPTFRERVIIYRSTRSCSCVAGEGRICPVCAIILCGEHLILSESMDGDGAVPSTVRNVRRVAKLKLAEAKRRQRNNHVAPTESLQKRREGGFALRQSSSGALDFHRNEAREKVPGKTDWLHRN